MLTRSMISIVNSIITYQWLCCKQFRATGQKKQGKLRAGVLKLFSFLECFWNLFFYEDNRYILLTALYYRKDIAVTHLKVTVDNCLNSTKVVSYFFA